MPCHVAVPHTLLIAKIELKLCLCGTFDQVQQSPSCEGLSFHRRIRESLFALALVEPTQYVTHDVSIPDTCPVM